MTPAPSSHAARDTGGPRRACRHRWPVAIAALVLALPATLPAAPPMTAPADPAAGELTAFETTRRAIVRGDWPQALAWAGRADPRERDLLGRTLLHEAVRQGGDPDRQAATIQALLRAGVPVDARDQDDRTALHVVLGQGVQGDTGGRALKAVVELLLAQGARLAPEPARAGPDAPSLLATLVMNGVEPALLQRLLQQGLSLRDDAVLRVVGAADNARQIDCALLVLRHAPPALLQHRDAQGRTAVHEAAGAAARLPLLQGLAQRGADLRQPDARGSTPFAEAAAGNNLAGLQWLAAQGALSLAADADGETPLHRAARQPRAQTLQWLLDQGADLQARDHRGRRAVDVAIDTARHAQRPGPERLALVRLLGGTESDALRGRLAGQPLLRAIHERDLRRVERLLSQGADPDVPDEWGHAALHYALQGISSLPNTPAEQAFARRLLPLLLRHGADPHRIHDAWLGTTYVDDARRLRVHEQLASEMRAAGVAERPAAGKN